MNIDFTTQDNQSANLSTRPNQMVADDSIDTKISVLGFIEEQHDSETPFIIELEGYLEI